MNKGFTEKMRVSAHRAGRILMAALAVLMVMSMAMSILHSLSERKEGAEAGLGLADDVYAGNKFTMYVGKPKNAPLSTIKCRWKSELKGVAFYRLKCDLDGETVKTVFPTSKQRSYTFRGLKKNRGYHFSLEAYGKDNEVRKSRGYYIFTGIDKPMFDDFENSIEREDYLKICFFDGRWSSVNTSKIILFKEKQSGGWKKIKSFKVTKKNLGCFEYTDKKVTAGRKYNYRLRAYGKTKIKGKTKTIKSAFTNITMEAVNRDHYDEWEI